VNNVVFIHIRYYIAHTNFILKSLVTEVTANTVKTDNNTIIPSYTVIWTAGVTPSKLIAELPCEHDRGHRIILTAT
jgi:NADH:ubiquinone reductase (H+-translocating)